MIEDLYKQREAQDSSPGRASKAMLGSRRNYPLAPPLERLGAVILDLFVALMPLLILVSSPLQKQMTKSLLIGDQDHFTFWMASLVVADVVLVIVYQTVMVWLFGGTCGKLFFGLRVEKIWGSPRPSLSDCLKRSLLWIGEVLLLAVPLVAVLSDSKRRPLHDKFVDTIVVSTRATSATSPTLREIALARSIYSLAILIVFLLALSTGRRAYRFVLHQAHAKALLAQSVELCSDVDDALDHWSQKGEHRPDRLNVAMTLFAAGKVDKDCLQKEVNYDFYQGYDSSTAYLARSFVYAENEDLSSRYLDHVCEVDASSAACQMSRIIDAWNEGHWQEVDKGFRHISSPKTYVKIWEIRHFINQGEFSEALTAINHLTDIRPLSSFLAQQRIKSYWGLHRVAQAKAAAAVALTHLDYPADLNLASWMCVQENFDHCNKQPSRSCAIVNNYAASYDGILADAHVALSLLLQRECAGKKDSDNSDLTLNDNVAQLVTALNLYSHKENHAALVLLQNLTTDSSADEMVRAVAARRLIAKASNLGALNIILQSWEGDSEGLEWVQTGKLLLRRYLKEGAFKRALHVGERLVKKQADDREINLATIMAAYKSGDRNEAKLLYQHWLKLSTARMPASIPAQDKDEWSKVKAALDHWSIAK